MHKMKIPQVFTLIHTNHSFIIKSLRCLRISIKFYRKMRMKET